MNYYDYGSTSDAIATTSNVAAAAAAVSGGMFIFSGLFALYSVIVMWKIYTKAGEKGWKSLVPIYNSYILCKIAGKEGWFFLLLCIPFVNIYAIFAIFIGLAHKFGKSTGFGVGCVFLNIIFLSILAFSKDCVYEDGYASSYVSNNDANYGQGMQTPNGQQFNNVNAMQNTDSFNQGVQMQPPVEQQFNGAAPTQNANPFNQGVQVQPPVEQQFNGAAPAQNANPFDQGMQTQPPVEQQFNGVAPSQNVNPFGQGIQAGSPSQNTFDNMNNMQDLSSFNQNNNLNQ